MQNKQEAIVNCSLFSLLFLKYYPNTIFFSLVLANKTKLIGAMHDNILLLHIASQL